MSAGNPRIPDCVVLRILEAVTPVSRIPLLHAASTVSRRWRPIAQRLLFRVLVVRGRDPPVHFSHVVTFLQAHPRICSYAAALKITGQTRGIPLNVMVHSVPVLDLADIPGILNLLPHVQSVTLDSVICTADVVHVHPRAFLRQLSLRLVQGVGPRSNPTAVTSLALRWGTITIEECYWSHGPRSVQHPGTIGQIYELSWPSQPGHAQTFARDLPVLQGVEEVIMRKVTGEAAVTIPAVLARLDNPKTVRIYLEDIYEEYVGQAALFNGMARHSATLSLTRLNLVLSVNHLSSATFPDQRERWRARSLMIRHILQDCPVNIVDFNIDVRFNFFTIQFAELMVQSIDWDFVSIWLHTCNVRSRVLRIRCMDQDATSSDIFSENALTALSIALADLGVGFTTPRPHLLRFEIL